jgi:DNA-directed RNA polymerase II subunit RPB2
MRDAWQAIDAFFRDTPYFLTAHHLESFDDFVDHTLTETIRSMNPISMVKEESGGKKYSVELSVGGKAVYMDKPTVVDPDGTSRPLFPNEARLKDLTYASNVYADVAVQYRVNDELLGEPVCFESVHIGMLPIMLHSRMCLLHGMPAPALREMGECPNDRGGYFVIDGKEKVVITQESRVNNRLYLREGELADKDVAYKAFIRCMPRDKTDVFPRTTTIRVRSSSANTRPNTIGLVVAHVDGEVPLFILFRALGVESDLAIIKMIVRDIDEEPDVVEFLRSCAADAGTRGVYDQRTAVAFLVPRTRFKTEIDLKSVLVSDLFPNVGTEFAPKARMLGYVARRVVRVSMGKAPVSQLDDYVNKRLELSGFMTGDLFRDIYFSLRENCLRGMNAEFYSGAWKTSGNLRALVNAGNVRTMLPPGIVRDQLIRGMKGSWGASDDASDDKAEGKVQDMNRVSFMTYASHVRRVNNQVTRDVKMADPHKMLASHWGAVCPVESPDGPNIGLLNHLSVFCHVSPWSDPAPLLAHLRGAHLLLADSAAGSCKVLVNDTWEAGTDDPPALVARVRELRRGGAIDRFVSVAWNIIEGEVHIHTDRGRCCRPLIVVDPDSREPALAGYLRNQKRTQVQAWDDFFHPPGASSGIPSPSDEKALSQLRLNAAPLEMIDVEELLTRLVAMTPADIVKNGTHRYTHCELHPAGILSAVTNTYPMLNHNNAAYNVLCLAQFKQAIGTYVTNFDARMDTMGCVLHYPQRPLVSTDFADKMCGGQLAHGENLIVAIGTYTGYNQEDSILLNLDSVERGRFNLTYYKTERFMESVTPEGGAVAFGNTLLMEAEGRTVRGVKFASYDKIGPDGFPLRNSLLREDDIMMGCVEVTQEDQGLQNKDTNRVAAREARRTLVYTDRSKKAGRSGENCVVDRVFVYPRDDIKRCKVRLRQVRQPELGDKLGSRFGQKGVVGLLLRSRDMPFGHESGIVPDIVLNPNAFPKRMTVAHLLECLLAKTASLAGSRYNVNNFEGGDVVGEAAATLTALGLNQHGDEVMYNGRSGEQIQCNIFVGVNYYGRFKHMVQDKYQYRTRGPVNAIVRQPTKGGDEGGGLRLGEMEQNALMSHGIASFVKESFMDRSDRHRMPVSADEGIVSDRAHATGDDRDHAPRRTADVEVPYAFKLLQQELQAMCIDARMDVLDGGDDREESSSEDVSDDEDEAVEVFDEGDETFDIEEGDEGGGNY